MAEEASNASPATIGISAEVAARAAGTAAQVKIGSRLGVWGLVGGLGTMTAFTLGAPISLATAISVMGGGVLLSGLGTLLAGTAALRSTRPLPRLVRAAALVGLPLGAVLSLLGLTSLTQWGPLVSIVNALTPAAGVLGALVVVLLVVGFFVGLPNTEEDEPT